MLWDRVRSMFLVLVFGLVASGACSDAANADAMSSATTDPESKTSASGSPAAGSAGSRALGNMSPSAPQTGVQSAPSSGGAVPDLGNAGAAASMTPPPDLTPLGPGTCCPGGNCLCRADPPAALSGDKGPHTPAQYELGGVGCVFYPSDAAPPYAAVAMADGFGGSGGCESVQIGEWGPLYASHGIVAVIIDTATGDQPSARGEKLGAAISALKAENEKTGSPLFGKLAGRYGTAGFSMGGGGSAFAAQADKTLLSNVALMPWNTEAAAVGGNVPTLIVCGDNDAIAPCSAHGSKAYAKLEAQTPKLRVTVSSDNNGQPSAAMGASGGYVLAFQKLFLEGDTRWRPLLVMAKSDETTIK